MTALSKIKRHNERYHSDESYRKRKIEVGKKHYQKNKINILKRQARRQEKLSEFKNKRCRVCNKLLHHLTRGNYCRSHRGGR